METNDPAHRPEIEDPHDPIFEIEAQPKGRFRLQLPGNPESRAGVGAVAVALLLAFSVMIAGRAGNQAYFTMQSSFELRLQEASARQQLLALQSRLDLEQALKHAQDPAELQSEADLAKQADDLKGRADASLQAAQDFLALQVILMRAATLFSLALVLTALGTLWERKFLWRAGMTFGALGLLFFLGGIL
jgi:hypothetical protein